MKEIARKLLEIQAVKFCPKAKGHGLENRIEGIVEPGDR